MGRVLGGVVVMTDRVLVLFSGGLDSAVLVSMFPNAIALSFDYGQPHRIEINHARRFCQARGIIHLVVPLALAGGGLLDADAGSPVVPGRNLAMLALAASYAIEHGADQIAIGVTLEDRDLFADCRSSFVHAFNGCAAASALPVRAIAPLIDKTKAQIVELCGGLGIDTEETWSCYAGAVTPGGLPCGHCLACRVRNEAIAKG